MLNKCFNIVFLLLMGLVLAGTSQAQTKQYSLQTGSGGQFHIGNGLPLPVRNAVPPGVAFPTTLQIPFKAFAAVTGTTTNTTNQKLMVPKGVLKKAGVQGTVGVWFSNNKLYAVGTNLSFEWPATNATFSVNNGPRSAGQSTIATSLAGGLKIKYTERVVGKRFGGPGTFIIKPGANSATSGILNSPVTVYGLKPATPFPPPCIHPALTPFFGPQPPLQINVGCGPGYLAAAPTGPGAAGGAWGNVAGTTGPPANIIGAVGKFGPGTVHPTGPLGTVSLVNAGPSPAPGTATNQATSTGFPFTTAIITLSATGVTPSAEVFVISGADTRSAGGKGTIQMVAGSLSNRAISGPNANRAWVKLVLGDYVAPPVPTPAMSTTLRGVTVVLIALLAVGYLVVLPRIATNE